MKRGWSVVLFSVLWSALFLHLEQKGWPSEDCQDTYQTLLNTRIRSLPGSDHRSCMVMIHPAHVDDLVYRNYLFNQDGLLMIFNSYGDGPEETTTGARSFYLFPRHQNPAFATSEDTVKVRMANGRDALFDAERYSFESLEGAEVRVSPEIQPDNQGGVEIQISQGLILDCGFTLGRSPESNPDASSVFVDSHGKRCIVKNRDVFKYSASGDATLFFQRDSELKAFLVKRCPNIDVHALRH